MTIIQTFCSSSLGETDVIGARIAALLELPACVYLNGAMGSGKTTLCKSIIGAFGIKETVTSPTYNLVHEYRGEAGRLFHLDLYRLQDPQELEFLALADLWTDTSLFLIEWPERGEGVLQAATHTIDINAGNPGSPMSREIVLSTVYAV